MNINNQPIAVLDLETCLAHLRRDNTFFRNNATGGTPTELRNALVDRVVFLLNAAGNRVNVPLSPTGNLEGGRGNYNTLNRDNVARAINYGQQLQETVSHAHPLVKNMVTDNSAQSLNAATQNIMENAPVVATSLGKQKVQSELVNKKVEETEEEVVLLGESFKAKCSVKSEDIKEETVEEPVVEENDEEPVVEETVEEPVVEENDEKLVPITRAKEPKIKQEPDTE